MERHDVLSAVKIAAAVIIGVWGAQPVLFQLLIGLMALDFATGLLAGFVTRSLSSDVSGRGIAKKAIVLLVVAAGWLLEPPTGFPIGQVVAGFYAVHEGLSILENTARAGLPVPQELRAALQKLAPETPETSRAPETPAAQAPRTQGRERNG